jgi:hypothetical protein
VKERGPSGHYVLDASVKLAVLDIRFGAELEDERPICGKSGVLFFALHFLFLCHAA